MKINNDEGAPSDENAGLWVEQNRKEITNDMIKEELMINKTHRIMINNCSHCFSSTGTTSDIVDEGHCKGDSKETMALKNWVRRKERG